MPTEDKTTLLLPNLRDGNDMYFESVSKNLPELVPAPGLFTGAESAYSKIIYALPDGSAEINNALWPELAEAVAINSF